MKRKFAPWAIYYFVSLAEEIFELARQKLIATYEDT